MDEKKVNYLECSLEVSRFEGKYKFKLSISVNIVNLRRNTKCIIVTTGGWKRQIEDWYRASLIMDKKWERHAGSESTQSGNIRAFNLHCSNDNWRRVRLNAGWVRVGMRMVSQCSTWTKGTTSKCTMNISAPGISYNWSSLGYERCKSKEAEIDCAWQKHITLQITSSYWGNRVAAFLGTARCSLSMLVRP